MTRAHLSPALRTAALALAAGLLFCAILYARYAGMNPDFYQYRDDGIITLSHARNWVDFGFIGVNPSGERLEASSAPLQLLLYAAAYGLSGIGYQGFMDLQTLACSFALGALFAQLFAARPWFALAATCAAALLLTELPAFMVWHGSGMENALGHVFLLWTVVLLHRFAADARTDLRWVVVPFLASICRVEAIFHVAPLLLLFCMDWHSRHGGRQARNFTAWFAGLWLLFNLCRYAYFGSLLPNTAVAQGISIGERLVELVTLSPIYLDQSFGLARANFSRLGGYFLLLAAPFVVFRRPAGTTSLLMLMAACLIFTALLAPFVFGPARLDTARTTTQLALFVPVAVAAAIHGWKPARSDAYVLPVVALLTFMLHEYNRYQPANACCSSVGFEQVRKEFARIALAHGLARPTVANPDLGAVSWHKQFNIVDLGLLGSSLVPRLSEAQLNEYLLEYAAPDIVFTHTWWTCRYAGWLTDPRFAQRYEAVPQAGPTSLPCKGLAVPSGYWVRKDVMAGSGSAERALVDALMREPSAAKVTQALHACRQINREPAACAFVARAAYRVLPELRAQGTAAQLEPVFGAGPGADADLFLLSGAHDPRAWRKALDFFQRPNPR